MQNDDVTLRHSITQHSVVEAPCAGIHSQGNLNDLICVHFFTATVCFMIGVQGLNDEKCGATINGIGTFRLSNNACDTNI